MELMTAGDEIGNKWRSRSEQQINMRNPDENACNIANPSTRSLITSKLPLLRKVTIA
jgi:hypothetical protein